MRIIVIHGFHVSCKCREVKSRARSFHVNFAILENTFWHNQHEVRNAYFSSYILKVIATNYQHMINANVSHFANELPPCHLCVYPYFACFKDIIKSLICNLRTLWKEADTLKHNPSCYRLQQAYNQSATLEKYAFSEFYGSGIQAMQLTRYQCRVRSFFR